MLLLDRMDQCTTSIYAHAGNVYEIHRGAPGGVLSIIDELKSIYIHPGERVLRYGRHQEVPLP